MKKLVLLLMLVCGCQSNDLQFKTGDVVDLKIGGQDRVIKILREGQLLIRIPTENGFDSIWLNEFELETP